MAFTCTSLLLNLYTSVFGCGCGFAFEQKFQRIDGFGEKKGTDWRICIPLFTPLLYVVVNFFNSKGAFVWDQSGIRIIGIMQVSVCLGAILIPEYRDSILAILLPGAE